MNYSYILIYFYFKEICIISTRGQVQLANQHFFIPDIIKQDCIANGSSVNSSIFFTNNVSVVNITFFSIFSSVFYFSFAFQLFWENGDFFLLYPPPPPPRPPLPPLEEPRIL